jgi:type II secretion system protein G
MKKILSSDSGFTLFELLVVISIIGILLALGTVAYSNAQKRARDSRARSDIKAMADAMEQYYVKNNEYPAACSDVEGETFQNVWPPNDPRGRSQGESGYAYSGVSDSDCSVSGYCFCAHLEQEKGGNATDANCSSWTNDFANADYYCMEQQQ